MMLSAIGPCREWQGLRNRNGYGIRRLTRFKSKLVHRQIMEMVGRDIENKVVMHTCDNPACFVYDHLRIGTQADNLADMAAKGRASNVFRGRTHCIHGHEFTEENTYRYQGGGRDHRSCRTCHRLRRRKDKK